MTFKKRIRSSDEPASVITKVDPMITVAIRNWLQGHGWDLPITIEPDGSDNQFYILAESQFQPQIDTVITAKSANEAVKVLDKMIERINSSEEKEYHYGDK